MSSLDTAVASRVEDLIQKIDQYQNGNSPIMTIFYLRTLEPIIIDSSKYAYPVSRIIVPILKIFRVQERFMCNAELKSTFDEILDRHQ